MLFMGLWTLDWRRKTACPHSTRSKIRHFLQLRDKLNREVVVFQWSMPRLWTLIVMIIDHADSCMNVPFMLWRAIDHIWKMLIIAMNRHWSCMITYIFISSWTLSWPLGWVQHKSGTPPAIDWLVGRHFWGRIIHLNQDQDHSPKSTRNPETSLKIVAWLVKQGGLFLPDSRHVLCCVVTFVKQRQ